MNTTTHPRLSRTDFDLGEAPSCLAAAAAHRDYLRHPATDALNQPSFHRSGMRFWARNAVKAAKAARRSTLLPS